MLVVILEVLVDYRSLGQTSGLQPLPDLHRPLVNFALIGFGNITVTLPQQLLSAATRAVGGILAFDTLVVALFRAV